MATNELIVDDEYCKAMGAFFIAQGNKMDNTIVSYLLLLGELSEKGIIKGEASNALKAYVTYASTLKQKIGQISQTASKQIDLFISSIDKADQYLF